MEKLCIFCEHFYFENIDTGWGDYPEPSGGVGCKAKHFYGKHFLSDVKFHAVPVPDDGESRDVDGVRPYDEKELRELLLSASKCSDYSPPQTQEK